MYGSTKNPMETTGTIEVTEKEQSGMTRSAHLLWYCPALLLFTAATAFAQTAGYPSKPIRLIVPYVAGGPSDLFARAVGNLLTEAWGQPVIIDNRPGASGNVGVLAAVRSPADGYTLTTVSIALAVSPALDSKLAYDPVK